MFFLFLYFNFITVFNTPGQQEMDLINEVMKIFRNFFYGFFPYSSIWIIFKETWLGCSMHETKLQNINKKK